MSKNLFSLFSFLFFGITSMQAQQFQVSGVLVDQNKQPIEWAEVYLTALDSTFVRNTIIETNGRFLLKDTPAMRYSLQVVYFGKTSYQKDILLESNLDLGEIVVENETQLSEIVVQAQKKLIERKVDRLVFNVENSISATGGDAMDALKVTPGLRIQNDLISMVGKSSMSVMVDDRLIRLSGEDLANYLKTIPSDNIKSIEVITSPPAKYEAEGNSGLINIQLKTTKQDSWNAMLGTSYLQRVYPTATLQGSFNYNKNKWSLVASLNSGSVQKQNVDVGKTYFEEELWTARNPRKIEQDYISTRLGADYKVSDRWTTGAQYLGSFYTMDITEKTQTARSTYEAQQVNSYIKSLSNHHTAPNLNSINWHNIYKVDTVGTKISVDLDYFSYKSNDNRTYGGQEWTADLNSIPNTFFAGINGNQKDIKNYSGKIDIELPSSWANWTFGSKFSRTNTNNNLVFYNKETGVPVLDPTQSNIFDYTEINEAFYVSATKKISPKWETQIGLRFEATQTKGYSYNYDQTNSKDYLKLFPTVYVVYNANEDHSFSLDYSRRVYRPNYEQLNPFRMSENPFTYIEGNPFLQPSLMDNLSFTHTFKGKWVNKLYFSKQSDGFEQVSIVDLETQINQIIPLNYFEEYTVGLSESYTFNTWSWWSSVNDFGLSYRFAKSSIPWTTSRNEGLSSSFSSNNDFILNRDKTIVMSVNYWIDFPGVSSFYNYGTSSSLDVAFKVFFLEKKLSLTLSGYDIFSGQRQLSTGYSNGIKISYRNYYDSQSVRFSVNYSFGNSKLKVAKRDFGNEEENKRVN